MDTTPGERRKSPRYPTTVPVRIGAPDAALCTLSRDLSAAGAYVYSSAPLAVGNTVDVRFAMPHHETFRQTIGFRGWGTVVRVEKQPAGDFGIALALFGMQVELSEA